MKNIYVLQLFWKKYSARGKQAGAKIWSGLQLRKSEQNSFHDNCLISQPNPMMWPSLKVSLQNDSDEW